MAIARDLNQTVAGTREFSGPCWPKYLTKLLFLRVKTVYA
jgi:hypothetical protein